MSCRTDRSWPCHRDPTGRLECEHLLVGWLDSVGLGEGFDSFRIDIQADGMTFFDRTFTDPSSALMFFDDRLLDLGSWADLIATDHWVELVFNFSLTASRANSGFYVDFVAANGIYRDVPPSAVREPSILWLFGAGSVA
jgi:hypothetical protein